ncbi:11325_t:CDS:2, partial [Paraglomus occultum]
DIMFAYGMKLKEESLVHSWILDLSDARVQGLFTKEEWKEIRTYNVPKMPKFPKELAKHMVSYEIDDVEAL